MNKTAFFKASTGTLEEITNLFSFVWPTAAAMWNLRWQVAGFLEAVPKASAQDLQDRFVLGSGIRRAGNLKGACIQQSWGAQQLMFAKFLLIDLCALYESWIGQVLNSLAVADSRAEKELQFPTTQRGGVRHAIQRLTSSESSVIRHTFYPQLARSPKCNLNELDPLLHCYRYFKESRNCIAHAGGICDQRTADAFAEFARVASVTQMGVREVPEHVAPVVGQPIQMPLRGVVGFSDVVLRIIWTLDAELSRSAGAERHLSERWTRSNPGGTVLPVKPADRRDRIARMAAKAGLPRPQKTDQLEAWLLRNGLVR